MSMELARRYEEDLKRVIKMYRGRIGEAREKSKTIKKFCSKIDQGFLKLGMMPSVDIDARGYVNISCKDTAEARRVAAMVVRRTCVRKLKKSMKTWVEPGKSEPEWEWKGENGGEFSVTIGPATPNSNCKPTIQTTHRNERSWVCEM